MAICSLCRDAGTFHRGPCEPISTAYQEARPTHPERRRREAAIEGYRNNVDPEAIERLIRIEAKIDALSDWSPISDSHGRLITKGERAETERRFREGTPLE